MADPRRRLPSVEALVQEAERQWPRLSPDKQAAPRRLLTSLARAQVADLRARKQTPQPSELKQLGREVVLDTLQLLQGTLRPLINATGVILQTNLGRGVLSEAAVERVLRVARGYLNLEYDVVEGKRGDRARSLRNVFMALVGSPALVVNNNAASLLLVLAALAKGKEVIVSRGELIEIGGSFRLPDVMRLSGAKLVEVGTTNRTRLEDYRKAITEKTAMVLKVHTSNYRVVGFAESVTIIELAALAQRKNLLAVEDLGSGSLLDTSKAGFSHEPTVQEALRDGADLVCFSGDKLLGGPPAGIIGSRTELIDRVGKHPMYRVVRPDKLTLAALEATLSTYLRGVANEELPVWQMLMTGSRETKRRAQAWADAINDDRCEIVPVTSAAGGGSLPGETLPGHAPAA